MNLRTFPWCGAVAMLFDARAFPDDDARVLPPPGGGRTLPETAASETPPVVPTDTTRRIVPSAEAPKVMRLLLRDGSVFEGTAMEIVSTMQARFRANHLTLADFAVWFGRTMSRLYSVDLHVSGASDAECAERLIRALLATGLAVEEHLRWK